mmetsp:Transcript_21825/g.36453  ORF Transcript_21825/g.36453 Transcript_21825/m.36453 type:complete len:243 (+) Transcript_21825:1094-1822(+)
MNSQGRLAEESSVSVRIGSYACTQTKTGAMGWNFFTVISRIPSVHTACTVVKSASLARRSLRCSTIRRPSRCLASMLSSPSSVTLSTTPSACTPGTVAITLYVCSSSSSCSVGSHDSVRWRAGKIEGQSAHLRLALGVVAPWCRIKAHIFSLSFELWLGGGRLCLAVVLLSLREVCAVVLLSLCVILLCVTLLLVACFRSVRLFSPRLSLVFCVSWFPDAEPLPSRSTSCVVDCINWSIFCC